MSHHKLSRRRRALVTTIATAAAAVIAGAFMFITAANAADGESSQGSAVLDCEAGVVHVTASVVPVDGQVVPDHFVITFDPNGAERVPLDEVDLPNGEDNTFTKDYSLASLPSGGTVVVEADNMTRVDSVNVATCNSDPDPVDVCPNLEGDQAEVPPGMVVLDGDCVTYQPPPVDNGDPDPVDVPNVEDGHTGHTKPPKNGDYSLPKTGA